MKGIVRYRSNQGHLFIEVLTTQTVLRSLEEFGRQHFSWKIISNPKLFPIILLLHLNHFMRTTQTDVLQKCRNLRTFKCVNKIFNEVSRLKDTSRVNYRIKGNQTVIMDHESIVETI